MTLTLFVVLHPCGSYQVFGSRDDAEPFRNPMEGGKPIHPKPLEVIEYVAVPKHQAFYDRQNGEKR